MTRWSTSCTNSRRALLGLAVAAALSAAAPALSAADREPMTLRVVAVNPSADTPKTVPVRIELPQEVTPADVLESGELSIEFDEEESKYYAFKEAVTLAPKQTRVFEISVRDVWFIPEPELQSLKAQTRLTLQRLEKTDYYPSAQQLAESIVQRLDGITGIQGSETISRKQQIGAFRRHTLMLKDIKDDLTRLEKLLSFAGGPPVPSMLEESPLKSDSPSTTTTWLVIFLIVIFMGLLAGQFFFTWQRRLKAPTAEPDAFPQAPPGETPSATNREGR